MRILIALAVWNLSDFIFDISERENISINVVK